jgi:hypothetical protein
MCICILLDIDYHPMMMLDVFEIDTILFLRLVSLVQLSGKDSSRPDSSVILIP